MATSSGPGAGSWDSPTRPDNSPTAQRLPKCCLRLAVHRGPRKSPWGKHLVISSKVVRANYEVTGAAGSI